jgi:hypothetical protein
MTFDEFYKSLKDWGEFISLLKTLDPSIVRKLLAYLDGENE